MLVGARLTVNFSIGVVVKQERSAVALPPFKNRRGRTIRFVSFTGRLNVDINLLRAAPAKQPASVNKKQHQNDDYEDCHHRDNACTSATATILSHEGFLLLRELC